MKFVWLVKGGMLVGLILVMVMLVSPTLATRDHTDSIPLIWQDIAESTIAPEVEQVIIPQHYRTLTADLTTLKAQLAQAPTETASNAYETAVLLTLPLPDGTWQQYRIIESPIMTPELAAKFPNIQTYIAKGVEDVTAYGRLDITPFGFHAMIFSSRGTFFIDPYGRNRDDLYISYFKRDFLNPAAEAIELGVYGEKEEVASGGVFSTGPQLRTYRTVVAATGEYTTYHGGTVPLAMAEIVTAMNRVSGIYEREVAVRMVLVANNDSVVYTNGATDPYSNGNGLTMLGENQANLDAVIGNPNYDVGHVFSTGGGGVANIAVICRNNQKARGVTGRNNPVGDPFYVDFVAHEMGHQFGARHTFNGTAGACTGGNHDGNTAFEPGSGSTIMAYAGICGNQNLQPHSDDYFHGASFDEIANHTQLGTGNNCAAITSTGNAPPVVEAGAGGFTIPVETPFTLTGSATDPNNDPLTYNWEQFDLGPAGHPNNPVGNAPLFRSFLATGSPSRTFPTISDIVGNDQTIGEILPTITRSLNFRLTARDNHVAPSAGGVAYDMISFSVTDTAGPFLVTNPNTAVTWNYGENQTVTWDVANTDAAPVSCANVNIFLSRDGGYTYPYTLLTNTPNDGSVSIAVPNRPTTTARLKIACANNIFFDISNINFIIHSDTPPIESFLYLPVLLR